ncbi:9198_t:CDS:2 [Paraglomus occultum]|uniref:9198_t:CDS:1 n=1 Tax=Paraglomus occultum TaxID=144539 RepID=A0A9N9D6D2_9GLOM|nr:9198_t:CDS:2 [Paraglomus occultum]
MESLLNLYQEAYEEKYEREKAEKKAEREESRLVFTFYSSDMDEPPHVHVEYKEGGTMKIWIAKKDLEIA